MARSGRRAAAAELLLPPVRAAVRLPEVLLVMLLAAAGEFFRLGAASTRGTIWAEDGQVFLQQALRDGPAAHIFTPYAGYMHGVPRIIAGLVSLLPISWQGVGLGVGAALGVGLVATTAYVTVAPPCPPRWARLLMVGLIVGVPVGPEVVDSIANLQWFLIPGALVALFYTPRRPAGWIGIGSVVLLATISSPFAVLPLVMAFVRLAVRPSRAGAGLFLTATAGFVVQTCEMIFAPPRVGGQATHLTFRVASAFAIYVVRVLGDSVLGLTVYHDDSHALQLRIGLAVAAVFTLLLIFALRDAGRRSAGLIALSLAALSVVALQIIVALTPVLTIATTTRGGRYFVSSAVLATVAFMVLVGATAHAALGGSARIGSGVLAGIGLLVVAALLFGSVTTWNAGPLRGRASGPSWSAGVAGAKQKCAAAPLLLQANVPISPRRWRVTVPCSRLRG